MSAVDHGFLREALERYVAINSVNPAFSGGTTDESEIAREVARDLERGGLEVRVIPAGPGRDSVAGRVPGTAGGPSLMLYAHMDTVGVEGMEAPFRPRVEDGRLYGRGAYDMKAGLASVVAVGRAVAAGGGLAGDVWVVGVADEETESIGMQAVLEEVRTDAAIVTEPTELGVCVAHKGFAWFRVTTHGVAAHGSRFLEGVDANLRMGRVLAELGQLERSLRETPDPHPLVGPPSLHAATLAGGTGLSTYASECRLEIERRLIPGEDEALARGQIDDIVRRLRERDPEFEATVETLLVRDSFEALPDSRIVEVLSGVVANGADPDPPVGGSYWMDAAFIAAAGIDTVVFGASGHGAHAVDEWVDVHSVTRHADILLETAKRHAT